MTKIELRTMTISANTRNSDGQSDRVKRGPTPQRDPFYNNVDSITIGRIQWPPAGLQVLLIW